MSKLRENLDNLLTLVKVAGTIEGRIKFQKIVFILKYKGIRFNETFKYHYYGPYSAVLHLEIEELVDREFLIEAHTNPYIYKLNPDKQIAWKENSDIKKNEKLIKFLNEQTSNQLELISTIFFLEKTGLTDKDIIHKKIAFLKPHLKDHLREAFQLKKQINSLI